jgi:hypothetical protein
MSTLHSSGFRTFLAVTVFSGMLAAQSTAPVFEVDPFWPKMPEKFILGPVRGVTVDAQDHVWIAQDGSSLSADMRGAAANPPQAECCMPAPPIMEFDSAGNFIKGWGGPGEGLRLAAADPRPVHRLQGQPMGFQ